MKEAELYPLGDAALLFEWPEGGVVRPGEIAAAAGRIRGLAMPGVKEMVPAYRSLAVHLDLEKLSRFGGPGAGLPEAIGKLAGRLREELGVATGDGGSIRLPGHVRIPVVYGGTEGPDLETCALRSGMTPEAFVLTHSSAVYEVAMVGFAPGFPYLSGLPAELAQPRHETPRLRVPAGSVGIAGTQTGVYPVDSPGGWQIIGRTAVPLFRPEAEEPFLVSPGDRVSFIPAAAHMERKSRRLRRPDFVEADKADIVLEVIRPGLLTTVQDRGRPGWQAFGISYGGAMDPDSLRTANAVVGNPQDAAVLEMTMLGAVFAVKRDVLAAFTGGGMEARLNGELLPDHRPVWLRAGTQLAFGNAAAGCRTYLAAAGGFAVPVVMGSRSTDVRAGIGGLKGRALQAGDRLAGGEPTPCAAKLAAALKERAERGGKVWAAVSWSAGRALSGGDTALLRVVEGAEWEAFGPEGQHILLETEFRVEASSDRMGLRLAGTRIPGGPGTELASHGVAPGTIQVPPAGLPIVLGPGCQPTGGYAKIAHVISADLPLIAQCRPGSRVKFELVSLEAAWEAWETKERGHRIMAAGLRLKGGDLSWKTR